MNPPRFRSQYKNVPSGNSCPIKKMIVSSRNFWNVLISDKDTVDKQQESEGHCIEERYPGIYYITNNLSLPIQIVVTSRLNPETHSSLRILSNHADKKDGERFLAEAEKLSSPESLNNVDAVLQVSVSANYDIYKEVRVHNVRWTLVLNQPKWKRRGFDYVPGITRIDERRN